MKKRQFQKLLQAHKDRVFGYAVYLLKNPEDAEDVVQEVFVKLWDHWESVDKKRAAAWLMKVTRHQCMDILRRKQMQGRHADAVLENDMASRDLENVFLNPAVSCEWTETQLQLMAAMDQLTEKTRQILILHYFQGFRYQTIGDIMDLNISAVKTAVHRGKQKLKNVLTAQYPEIVESL